MASANNKTRCATCNKENITYNCDGCSNRFCFKHLGEHREMLNGELDEIIDKYNQFQQTMNEQKQNSQNSSLIKQIDEWEITSILKIQQTADDCRIAVNKYANRVVVDVENKLHPFRKQMKVFQETNEFNEVNLNDLKEQLVIIRKDLDESSRVVVQRDSRPFIDKISIELSSRSKFTKISVYLSCQLNLFIIRIKM